MKKATKNLFFLLFIANCLNAQNVGINTTGDAPNASALLDLNTGNTFGVGTSKGLLIPNIALTSSTDGTTISSPAYSLLVYNTAPVGGLTPAGYYYNSGSPALPTWTQIGTGGAGTINPIKDSAWLLTGNFGTTVGTNFIGTNDGQPLEFKVDGQKAGWLDYTGNDNALYGYETGNSNTTGYDNAAVGYQALFSNTIGVFNTAIGYQALYTFNYTGAATGFNTAIGAQTLYLTTTGEWNTAVGASAMAKNTIGSENTAMGQLALYHNTIGNFNTGIGNNALIQTSSGSDNTGIGNNALDDNTVGNENTAAGEGALDMNVAGSDATAIGYDAMYYANNTTTAFTNNNVAVGYEALYGSNTPANNTGLANTAIGYKGLFNNTSGSDNTALGYQALNTNTTGSNNTTIGYQANVSANNLTNATAIGNGAVAPASNTITLGNTAVTALYCEVTSITSISDGRFKNNIKDDIHGLDFIMKLKPISYNLEINKLNAFRGLPASADKASIASAEKVIHNGFIAQDVEKAAQSVGYDFSGISKPTGKNGIYGLGYTDFVVPLVKSVQELNDSLQAVNKNLQAKLDKLMCLNNTQAYEMNDLKSSLSKMKADNSAIKEQHEKDEADIALLKKLFYSISQKTAEAKN